MTGAPEILGGRVKTLHPKIHGGILADLGDPDHVEQLVEQDIGPIDLVCINLYPFEETVAGGASEKEAIEQIDIGGPAILRAAAKNFGSVTVVPSPEFYEEVLATLESEGAGPRGEPPPAGARRVPADRRATTRRSRPGSAGGSKGRPSLPTARPKASRSAVTVEYERVSGLRYGENPHQDAAYYARGGCGASAQRRGEVAGAGDLLQQPLRSGRGPHPPRRPDRPRSPGRRYRQARQPLRRRDRGSRSPMLTARP